MTDTAEPSSSQREADPVKVGDTITVAVGVPVAGGTCLSRRDGQVVFLRGGLPGEEVRASVTGSGRGGGFLRADVVEVIEPSPHRVETPCRIADECGGCDWQHSDLGYQRELKATVLKDALKRTGGITEIAGVAVDDIIRVEALDDGNGLGWRSRMRYAVDSTGEVGLRAARSHRIIPAADCPLALPDLAAAIPDLVTNAGNERALVAAETSLGDVELGTTRSERTLTERVRARDFAVDINGFWQVHPRAPEVLVDAVLDFAELRSGQSAVDLYSGVGLFAAFMAEQVGKSGRIDAVEGDPLAVNLAKKNTNQLPWVTHHRSDILKWLRRHHEAIASPDVVVLDPPRAGANAAIVSELSGLHPSRIVYVACDAVALARDAKLLRTSGYEIVKLRAFDLFPMTKHFECVALFAPCDVA